MFLLLVYSLNVFSQSDTSFLTRNGLIDVGVGYNYGGIVGVSGIISPMKNNMHLQLFASIGYISLNTNKLGFSIGSKYLLPIKFKYANPFLEATFGTNAIVNINNATYLNRSFNGLSIGTGIDFYIMPTHNLLRCMNNSKFWQRFHSTFAILFPFENRDVNYYREYLNLVYGVKTNKLFPINGSIGFGYRIF